MNRVIAILLLSVGLLCAMGAVMLYSSFGGQPDMGRFFLHLRWLGIGAACGFGAALAPASWVRRWRLPQCFLLLSIVLLAAVFLPGIGVTHNGARRWLLFGQPSELAKLAVVVFLADYAARRQNAMDKLATGFLAPGILVGGVVALVFLEPDWGTAVLLGLVALTMLAFGGAHWFYLASTIIISSELFLLFLLANPLRMERILAFLEPERYRNGIGWQSWQSLLALGRGGLTGAFLGEGSQKNGFVPELQTDFVLSLIGEEMGLVGTLLVLGLFALILLCGARIAWRVNEPFGQFLALGISVLIAAQALLNIGVVSCALPNKGIALPFVSYGGSSLACMLVGIGLLVGVARKKSGPPSSGPLPTVQNPRPNTNCDRMNNHDQLDAPAA